MKRNFLALAIISASLTNVSQAEALNYGGQGSVIIGDVDQVASILTDHDETGDPGLIIYAGDGIDNSGNYTTYRIADFGVDGGDSNIYTDLNVSGVTSINSSLSADGFTNDGVLDQNGAADITGIASINTSGSASTSIGNSSLTLNNQTTISGSTDGSDAGLVLNGFSNSTSIAGVELNSNADVNITANNDNIGSGPEAINLVAGANSSSSLSVGAAADGTNGFITLNGPTTTINATTSTVNTTTSTLNASTSATVNTESFNVRTGTSTISATDASASLSSGSASFTSYSSGTTVNQGGDYTLESGDTASKAVVTGTLGTTGMVSNVIVGDTLVDGDVYINGSLTYSSDSSAVTSVTSDRGSDGLVTAGTTVANENSARYTVDANGALVAVDLSDDTADAAAGTTAALTVTNEEGNTHGVVVTEAQTTLSGGVFSSSMTLDDNGATFSDSATGAPIQVHGVNDGTADFDAINVRQFAGAIAATTAIANIPTLAAGENGSFGLGVGTFMGHQGVAMGGNFRVNNSMTIRASLATNTGDKRRSIAGVGAAWSW